jgi:F1F0 ATPase subunit 2
MAEALLLLLVGFAGGVLGTLFFGSLWFTIQMVAVSPRPAAWIMASLLLRMSVALLGFYWVSGGHFDRLLASLLGFVVARQMVLRVTRPTREATLAS